MFYVWVCACEYRYVKKPEALDPRGTGVVGCYELPDGVAEN